MPRNTNIQPGYFSLVRSKSRSSLLFVDGIKPFIVERIFHLIQIGIGIGIGTAIAHFKSSAHHDRGIFGLKPEHTLNVPDSFLVADPVLMNLALRRILV